MGGDVEVRELAAPEDMAPVVAVQRAVWGEEHVTPPSLLIMLVKSGGHVLAAFWQEKLVGFALAFPAVRPGQEPSMASHMLAVLPAYRGRGIGRALKWAQRDWCLARGFRLLTWTFDPLEAANAHLNLNVLGAVAPQYLVNAYGELRDRRNVGLPSDRLWVHWWLDSPRVHLAQRGELAPPKDGIRVPIPRDVQALKRQSLDKALEARLTVRRELTRYLPAGYEVVALDRSRSELILAPSGAPGREGP
jgi:predicted GNAT superfamily acetyltransferase